MLKRVKATTSLAGMILVLAGIFAGEALAAVADTRHNLSNTGGAAGNTIYSTDQTEICVFCHTPHAAIKNANIPLWNHALSTVTQYGVYASPTMTGAPAELGGTITDPMLAGGATASNLCLSCHDGSVAINSFSNPSNQQATTTMTGTEIGTDRLPAGRTTNLGSNLIDDHPVNFAYNTALVTADGSLVDPATFPATGGVKLFNGELQCASCHDPHTSADPTGRSFLRVSMNQSGLCMACHVK